MARTGAVAGCRLRNRRLCSYSEWFWACRQFAGQLQRMADDWELVDAPHYNVDGGLDVIAVGNGGCGMA